MTNGSYFSIYVGSEYMSTKPIEPLPIPRKWKPVLELAYAYTTNSINEALGNINDLSYIINNHSTQIDNIANDLNKLSDLNNEDFINKINQITDKIDELNIETITSLAYIYSDLKDQIVQDNSYSYSSILYELGISRSYDKINDIKSSLQNDINTIYSYVDNNYVTISYADSYLALQSNVPKKVSDLPNDALYVTYSSLTYYATTKDVDDRIEQIVDAAPEALDTLKEIAYALGNNDDLAGYLTSEIDKRATTEYVDELYNKTSHQNDDIPIYDESRIQELINAGELPNKYISIPSSDTITQTGESGKYLDIIFNTLRDLQKQISKIQRTFDRGLISMVNEHTHMSYVESEYSLIEESEPMWAVDPSSLSEITGAEFYIDNAHILEPTENVLVSENKLTISPYATWSDNHLNITSGKPNNYLYDCQDAKEYVFITSSTPNVKITLTNYSNDENNIIIDLSKIGLPVNEAHKYNILLCISRAVQNDKKQYVGTNFLFVSIGDYFTGETIWEKYYNKNNGVFISGYTLFNNVNDYSANEQNRYFISQIQFNELELYRMTFYSKYQDFGNDVQPSVPDDYDTYSVAHITIRSVKNIEQLKKIKNQLLENELIYNDSNNCIYIIKNNEIKLISGGSNTDPSDDTSGMEKNEILEWLEANGIVGLFEDITADNKDNIRLSLNNIGDITFINQLNEKYKFTVDSNGELKSTKVNKQTLDDRIKTSKMPTINEETTDFINTRGFVGTLREYETGNKPGTSNVNSDMKLNSDRIKIGNVYAPFKDSNVHGCTHGYIELENTSNLDFELDGCYLHFARRIDANTVEENSLPLSGVIPANGTYLIRCKKYSDIEQSNTFINVDSFDIEWITPQGELFDPYLGIQNAFLLTYKCAGKDWDPDSAFDYTTTMTKDGAGELEGNRVYHPCYIDSISILAHLTRTGDGTGYTWNWNGKGLYSNPNKLDAIYKTTFELDPAKQAYQGLHAKDSSRVRTNTATDYQTVYLQKEFIEFPKTDEKYPVAMYTPMASYLHKNVCTDKTKLDMEKPNMVTVAFGINMLKTRCFNWVSAGDFDEYIWVRQKVEDGQTPNAWKRFESYKTRSLGNLTKKVIGDDNKETIVNIGVGDIEYNNYRTKLNNNELTAPYRKEFTWVTNNAVYARIKKAFPGSGIQYTAHKCILEFDAVTEETTWEYVVGRGDKNKNIDLDHTSEIYTFTLYPSTMQPRLYQTTDQQGFHWIEYQTWAAAADYLNTFISNQKQNDHIIPVLLNTGDATQNGTRVNEWLDYYIGGKNLFNHLEQMSIVGNNDLCDNDPEILGTGDDSGKSNGFYHHVFYCYEVDEKLNDNTYITKLETHNDGEDQSEDLTFDEVYDAKRFKYLPLIKGDDNVYRYVPSFYWFGTPDTYTFVMMNSELTFINCGKWFNKKINNTHDGVVQTVNLYTGWSIPEDKTHSSVYDSSFVTIYTMLYNVINEHIANKKANEPLGSTYNSETGKIDQVKNLIIACHEMPFTVVTNANLQASTCKADRSLNGSSLVGSHMNKMNNLDNKSNYWFSRLLEHFNVKFVYGGHKHTYAITNELRELYSYVENGETKYSLNGKMTMPQTLEGDNDTANFNLKLKKTDTQVTKTRRVKDATTGEEQDETYTETYSSLVIDENGDTDIAASKFPLMNVYDDVQNTSHKLGISFEGNVLFPYYGVSLGDNETLNGVIYMMCQATGFKLKSNKELPGPNQRFSFIIPKTTTGDSSDTPSDEQLQPMFTEIHPDTHIAYLMRLKNIHSGKKVLSQTDYATAPILLQYLHRTDRNETNMYGAWVNDETQLLSW